MDTATGVKKQDYSATLISKFEEDNKNLTLTEKVSLIHKEAIEEIHKTNRYGWSDDFTTLYWHYKRLRDEEVHVNLRDMFKGVSYEEVISVITTFNEKLEKECREIKL